MDPRHAVLFEPIQIGPKTLPNRFYQVPHASGFGVERPRTQAAFRGIKAEGGWGGVCVDYTSISLECEESPAVSALFWDDADAQGARAVRRRRARARLPGRHRALPRRRAQRERPVTRHARRADAAPRALVRGQPGQGDGRRRHRAHPAGVGRGGAACARRRVRHRLRLRRPRLPAVPVLLHAPQPAHRRLRRVTGRTGAASGSRRSRRCATPSAPTARSPRGSR